MYSCDERSTKNDRGLAEYLILVWGGEGRATGTVPPKIIWVEDSLIMRINQHEGRLGKNLVRVKFRAKRGKICYPP